MGKGKEKRDRLYREAVGKMREHEISLGAAMSMVKHGYNKPWSDSRSPTGMMQICDYMGHCQYPCNGDC